MERDPKKKNPTTKHIQIHTIKTQPTQVLASSSLFSLPHTTNFQSENSTLISFSTILSFLSKEKKIDFVFFLFLDSGIESYWTFVLCFASVLDSKSWWWWCDGGCLLVMVLMVVLGWELEVSMLSNIGKLLLLRLL